MTTPNRYHPNIPDSEVIGWECRDSKETRKRNTCRQIIQSLRVNHLVKVHNISKKWIGKESNFEKSRYAHLFALKLKCDISCAHCDSKLEKYASSHNSDFVYFVCHNDDCSYKKKHNTHNYISELIVDRKKYYCARHLTNSDIPCGTCKVEKNFNKILVPRLNKIAGEILGK